MGDLLQFPLVGRGLSRPDLRDFTKARVYKHEGDWHWGHRCDSGPPQRLTLSAAPFQSWALAFQAAVAHVGRCR